jgi:hypothetical protein
MSELPTSGIRVPTNTKAFDAFGYDYRKASKAFDYAAAGAAANLKNVVAGADYSAVVSPVKTIACLTGRRRIRVFP